jgi:predicted dinucleotide-binding enzyme
VAHLAHGARDFSDHLCLLADAGAAVDLLIKNDAPVPAAQAILGDGVSVVSAFQNVGASHLREDHPVDCDVLVSGDKLAAREQVIALVEAAGMRGWHAGPLANSVAAEALTSILIGINKRYQIDGAGIRITGKPGNPSGKTG